jgi:hypothetical protein
MPIIDISNNLRSSTRKSIKETNLKDVYIFEISLLIG